MSEVALEGVKPKVEGVAPTPTEEAKPTLPKAEPTVKTYTQADLDKAVGKGTASISKLLASQKTVADKAERERKAFEVELKSAQTELNQLAEQQFADDPEARKAFLDRKAIANEQKRIVLERTKLEEERAEHAEEVRKLFMNRKADELMKETGIPLEEIKDCQTTEEMIEKAWAYEKAAKKESEAPPKFDSAISSASASGWSNEKVKEMLKTPKGVRELESKLSEVIAAARQGKLK